MALDKDLDAFKDVREEKTIDTTKKLRIGFIGCGWIAGSHMRAFKKQPDVEIVAGCDLIPGKAAAFFEKNEVEGV
ncbi:MAG: gfo/Idh/MocA family oxidoreductase, partial [Clostridia bacterium]|nr:gfo/Idh/MocA family oxidoreductase [Clostridia bacterium]